MLSKPQLAKLDTQVETRKLVLLLIAYELPLEVPELDEVSLNDALMYLRRAGLIEQKGKLWQLKGKRKATAHAGGTPNDHVMACRMYERIKATIPGVRPANMKLWSDDIRKMREIDRLSPDLIWRTFEFANAHHFWCRNVLSPHTLRRQWDRLIAEQEKQSHGVRTNGSRPSLSEQFAVGPVGRVIDG